MTCCLVLQLRLLFGGLLCRARPLQRKDLRVATHHVLWRAQRDVAQSDVAESAGARNVTVVAEEVGKIMTDLTERAERAHTMAAIRGSALRKSVQCGATHSRPRGPMPLEQTTLASLEFKPQMRAPSQRRPVVREGRAAAHRWSVVTGGGRARAGLQRRWLHTKSLSRLTCRSRKS